MPRRSAHVGRSRRIGAACSCACAPRARGVIAGDPRACLGHARRWSARTVTRRCASPRDRSFYCSLAPESGWRFREVGKARTPQPLTATSELSARDVARSSSDPPSHPRPPWDSHEQAPSRSCFHGAAGPLIGVAFCASSTCALRFAAHARSCLTPVQNDPDQTSPPCWGPTTGSHGPAFAERADRGQSA